jgi:hypothetical protein
MKNIKVYPLAILFCLYLHSNAQDFNVPKDITLVVAEDYAKYEKDIISCINWLENTPLNVDEQKRIEANAFLMKWLTGSPTVSINLDADIVVKCTDKNPQLLMLFLAGWTRYSLENGYSKDQQKGYFEGFKSMIKVYKKGISIKKDKDLENIIEIYDNGDLEKWISENIK